MATVKVTNNKKIGITKKLGTSAKKVLGKAAAPAGKPDCEKPILEILPTLPGVVYEQVSEYKAITQSKKWDQYNFTNILAKRYKYRVQRDGFTILRNDPEKVTILHRKKDKTHELYCIKDGMPIEEKEIQKIQDFASNISKLDRDEKGFRPFTTISVTRYDATEVAKETETLHKNMSEYYKKLIKKDLTRKPESDALMLYIGSYYQEINNYLVKNKDNNITYELYGDPSKKRSTVQEHTVHLWNLVNKCKLHNAIAVYRGTQDHKYKIGKIYRNPCFISCSVAEQTANGFNKGSIIQYLVPQGHPGLFVDAFRENYNGERELILPPLTRFKIIYKEKIGTQMIYKAMILM
jgi:ADP-ribosyltransferase exoenzyme